MLRSLGWRLHRVWTMEWLSDPDKILERIRREVESLCPKEEVAENYLIQVASGDVANLFQYNIIC